MQAGTGSGAGELQNTYVHFCRIPGKGVTGGFDELFGYPTGTLHPGATYARMLSEAGRRIPPGAGSEVARNDTLIGFHPWVAGAQKGISPYQAYEEYAEKIRVAGPDCSIVPEF